MGSQNIHCGYSAHAVCIYDKDLTQMMTYLTELLATWLNPSVDLLSTHKKKNLYSIIKTGEKVTLVLAWDEHHAD